jgi:hypothetical protein
MKIRILNKFNVDYLNETNREQIEVSEYDLSQIGITKCFDVENNRVIDYDNSEDLRIAKLEELRARREQECFSIINRGKLWYDTLTPEQLIELDAWYNDWLNVTITLEAPEKPEWLK